MSDKYDEIAQTTDLAVKQGLNAEGVRRFAAALRESAAQAYANVDEWCLTSYYIRPNPAMIETAKWANAKASALRSSKAPEVTEKAWVCEACDGAGTTDDITACRGCVKVPCGKCDLCVNGHQACSGSVFEPAPSPVEAVPEDAPKPPAWVELARLVAVYEDYRGGSVDQARFGLDSMLEGCRRVIRMAQGEPEDALKKCDHPKFSIPKNCQKCNPDALTEAKDIEDMALCLIWDINIAVQLSPLGYHSKGAAGKVLALLMDSNLVNAAFDASVRRDARLTTKSQEEKK